MYIITLSLIAVIVYIIVFLLSWLVASLGKGISGWTKKDSNQSIQMNKVEIWSKRKLESIGNRKRRLKYAFCALPVIMIAGLLISSEDSKSTDKINRVTTNTISSNTTETKKEKIKRITSSANTPRYKQLKKNPDRYNGTVAIYTGKVLQAQEGSGETHLRVEVTKGEYDTWNDVIFVVYPGITDIVEDDIVKIYGTLKGDYKYESQAGWEIHVPRMDSEVLEIVKKSD